jgi:purine-binding chemotaxis protein CheW
MNLRGQVVPVIDQARRFRGAAAKGERRRVIVVRLGELQAGFVVEAVSEVLRVPLAALRAAPDLGGEETQVFDRVANLEDADRMVLIVSPQELLDRAERALLAGISGKNPAAAS